MAKSKAELLEDAREAGVEIPDSKTIPEIKAILAEAAPKEPEVDAADATIPGDAENAPDSIQELAALDAPEAPLAHTSAESLTEYDAVGNLGAKHNDPDVKARDDGGVPPEVARGPLAGTPPDGWREDYNGPRFVAGPSQPVNTDPHQRGGADSKPDESDASREKVQEKANAPGQQDGEAGLHTGRVEDGDGEGATAPERADDAPSKPESDDASSEPVRVKDGV